MYEHKFLSFPLLAGSLFLKQVHVVSLHFSTCICIKGEKSQVTCLPKKPGVVTFLPAKDFDCRVYQVLMSIWLESASYIKLIIVPIWQVAHWWQVWYFYLTGSTAGQVTLAHKSIKSLYFSSIPDDKLSKLPVNLTAGMYLTGNLTLIKDVESVSDEVNAVSIHALLEENVHRSWNFVIMQIAIFFNLSSAYKIFTSLISSAYIIVTRLLKSCLQQHLVHPSLVAKSNSVYVFIS